jgi:hypothetical protein
MLSLVSAAAYGLRSGTSHTVSDKQLLAVPNLMANPARARTFQVQLQERSETAVRPDAPNTGMQAHIAATADHHISCRLNHSRHSPAADHSRLRHVTANQSTMHVIRARVDCFRNG